MAEQTPLTLTVVSDIHYYSKKDRHFRQSVRGGQRQKSEAARGVPRGAGGRLSPDRQG